jgi:REP element-mobilizing transposase RayT
MPRQARLDAPGTLHHVMIRGIEKGKIVDDRQDRQTFLDYMGQTALENDVKIYAFALMTNHAHILLKSGKAGISKYMRRFLTRYAMAYNRRHQRHGYLFQNRYKSIICEEDAYFQELVRYIHLNPLRANLVHSLRVSGGVKMY